MQHLHKEALLVFTAGGGAVSREPGGYNVADVETTKIPLWPCHSTALCLLHSCFTGRQRDARITDFRPPQACLWTTQADQ